MSRSPLSPPDRGPARPTLPRSELLAEITCAFKPSAEGEAGLRVGIEAELIAVATEGGERLALDPAEPGRPGLHELIARTAKELGGRIGPGPHGAPLAHVPGVGVFCFEPGGQIELSTAAFRSVDRLIDATGGAMRALARNAEPMGITLVTRGMDPGRPVADVPFVLDAERYRKQRAHYQRIGPWGTRMMLLSAGFHVNVDFGSHPARRWQIANRLAPILTALFANSPDEPGSVEAGTRSTGAAGNAIRSTRAGHWRKLDPSRTGLFADVRQEGRDTGAAQEEYLAFALGAHDFLGRPEGALSRPFRESWEDGADLASWRAHLTTLFPEVRPRGYLELRSVDALRPAWYAVPVVVAVGILYDPRTLAAAHEILPPATEALLEEAGRRGVTDEHLRARALDAIDLALSGARALGPGLVGEWSLERTEEFRRRFTAAGRDPGHEPDGIDLFEP
ncbi:MAG: hypothetical protein EA351_12340 [Gemmatimonadales bacterium]|nr:MAG: hypothetical protein EA351_12340 [Gemmatimonadales bacterium]